MDGKFSRIPAFLKPFVALLSKPQRRQVGIYVAGLIWIIKFRSIQEIAKKLGARQIDRLHHLLSCAPLDSQSLQHSTQADLARLAADQPAAMVLDDTVDQRKGKAIEGLGWHYSAKGLVQGLCAVTAMLRCGSKRLLWAIRAYRPRKSCPCKEDFRSKVSLALDILQEAKNHFGPGRLTVLMDCWYAAAAIVNFIDQAGWTFVSALRSNRNVYVQGKKRKLRHLAKGRRKPAFRTLKISRGRRVRFAVLAVDLPRFGPVQLALCRIGKTPWHYIITNNLRLSGRKLVQWYLQRSWIETLHREIKQHLGFGETFVRCWVATQRHWTLVALAYNWVMLHSAGRHRRTFRAKLEAYKTSMTQEQTIDCFEQIAKAH